jgi:hypothetical protein
VNLPFPTLWASDPLCGLAGEKKEHRKKRRNEQRKVKKKGRGRGKETSKQAI